MHRGHLGAGSPDDMAGYGNSTHHDHGHSRDPGSGLNVLSVPRDRDSIPIIQHTHQPRTLQEALNMTMMSSHMNKQPNNSSGIQDSPQINVQSSPLVDDISRLLLPSVRSRKDDLLFGLDEALGYCQQICKAPNLLDKFENRMWDIKIGRKSRNSLDTFFVEYKDEVHLHQSPQSPQSRKEQLAALAPLLRALKDSNKVSPLSEAKEIKVEDGIEEPDILWYEDRELFNARVTSNGKVYTKSFSVKDYHNRNKALAAAEEWLLTVKDSADPVYLLASMIGKNSNFIELVKDCHRKSQNMANISQEAPKPPPPGTIKKVSNTGIRGITWQETRKKFQCSIYMAKGKRVQKYFPTGLNSSGPRYEEAFQRAKEWMAEMEKEREILIQSGNIDKDDI